MPRTGFQGVIFSLHYIDGKDVEYNDGLFHMHKIGKLWNMNMAE